MDPRPADGPDDIEIITVKRVLDGQAPVRVVCHEVADGSWQFLDRSDPDPGDARLVRLSELCALEPGLLELTDLPLGWQASRSSATDPWSRRPVFPTDWDELLELALETTRERQDCLFRDFDFDRFERFDYDQEEASFRLSRGGEVGVTARFQITGSWSSASRTWLWSFANPHLVERARENVHNVATFGEQHGFPKLHRPKWPADEVEGWEMTAVAGLLLDAEGTYRAPVDTGSLFLLLSDIRRVA